jgi:hypothetical protein
MNYGVFFMTLDKPKRIQRKRTKGWRMPENTVYVGRGSFWGNPFKVGVDGDAKECIKKYANHILPFKHGGTFDEYIHSEMMLRAIKDDLKGKNLACWCKEGEPCHGDFLLELANDEFEFDD